MKRFVLVAIMDIPEGSKLEIPETAAWAAKGALRQLGFNIVSVDVEFSGLNDGSWTELAATERNLNEIFNSPLDSTDQIS